MTEVVAARPDHNSLGKAAFIVGLIGLIMAFVPVIGFVSWLLSPLAVLCGAIALRRRPRSLAIAGIVTGVLGLLICFWWVGVTKSVGEAINKDTFNTSGAAADLSSAPVMDASLKGLWEDIEANKVAAGTKYGGHRLKFQNEKIEDFQGDAATPTLTFIGKTDEFLVHMVSASFDATDGGKIAALKKGDRVTFICSSIKETLGDGYSLGGCKLQ